MRRRSKTALNFGQPLATPESKRVYHCYATHGIGYGKDARPNSAIRLVALDAAREVRGQTRSAT